LNFDIRIAKIGQPWVRPARAVKNRKQET